ncbi:nucleotide-binding universal stress UspA family protein [Dyadobacter jejuensis]|uniref:Nucleotide-binding universal stress UspA family protein n=1 Tax=Dyadobacter jejuensis TaxID=1082580 RepID=A0A316AQP9_9BACT|nr:universal stress protein [Dyadobacter jejuensis]PWJ59922.1 nucleotide-binding universal stress UspA family protein [Dyadobacter jejuensis]
MQSILFPTDFTELSLNAFTYAMEYAQKSNAKLIVYHCYEPSSPLDENTKAVYDQVDIQNFRKKKDKFPIFEKLIAESSVGELKVKYVVKEGKFVDTLKAYVAKKEEKIDLVIMGTHGNKSSLFNIFMETHTIKILEEINKPLFAIPERASFDGTLDNFAFIVDYNENEIQPLQEVIAKTQEFGSRLHVIHFDVAHSESIVPHMETFKSSLHTAHLDNVVFSSIDTIDIKKSLSSYCKENKIDIVCLVNHKRNYYQRLFSYSLSEELLYFLDIPVMAIYVD